MKLLIADDNTLTRKCVEAAAAKWGYEIVAVDDGLQAWDALRSDASLRLAILDWNMPGLAGTEICRRLRRTDNELYRFVILLTSNDDQKSVVEGLKAGADDFVRKPFHSAELQQRVHTGQRILALEDRLLKAQEQLRIQATRDPLTEVWNRREILRLLEHESAQVARGRGSLGVMLIDIDHFKSINDTFGHLVGDDVLRQVASVIKREVQGSDDVGRYGGEEFLAVLRSADREKSLRIGEQLRRSVCGAIGRVQQSEVNVSVSIGVACLSRGTIQPISHTVQQCDQALYRAKDSGRNRVCLAGDAGDAGHAPESEKKSFQKI